jgi:hypothetical protein
MTGNEPFLPHPLKVEVTHMDREPVDQTVSNRDIQAVSKPVVQLPDRLADCGSDSTRRELTQLSDQSNVVYGLVWRFWK